MTHETMPPQAVPQQTTTTTTSTTGTGAAAVGVPGPSREDAAALVGLATLHAQLQVSSGLDVLWRADFPTDPYTIDAWFAPGTEGRKGLEAVLMWFQTVGTLVKHGLLDGDLCRDWCRADLVWARIEPMARAERARTGDATMWANVEWLAASDAAQAPAEPAIELPG